MLTFSIVWFLGYIVSSVSWYTHLRENMKKYLMIISLFMSISVIHAGRVNIAGINKAIFLRKLFAQAKSQDPDVHLKTSEITALIKNGIINDLHGRTLNIDLSGNEVDTYPYNKCNGDNAADDIIEEMRAEQYN